MMELSNTFVVAVICAYETKCLIENFYTLQLYNAPRLSTAGLLMI